MNSEKKQVLSGFVSGIFIALGFGMLIGGIMDLIFKTISPFGINPIYVIISGSITFSMGIISYRNWKKEPECEVGEND